MQRQTIFSTQPPMHQLKNWAMTANEIWIMILTRCCYSFSMFICIGTTGTQQSDARAKVHESPWSYLIASGTMIQCLLDDTYELMNIHWRHCQWGFLFPVYPDLLTCAHLPAQMRRKGRQIFCCLLDRTNIDVLFAPRVSASKHSCKPFVIPLQAARRKGKCQSRSACHTVHEPAFHFLFQIKPWHFSNLLLQQGDVIGVTSPPTIDVRHKPSDSRQSDSAWPFHGWTFHVWSFLSFSLESCSVPTLCRCFTDGSLFVVSHELPDFTVPLKIASNLSCSLQYSRSACHSLRRSVSECIFRVCLKTSEPTFFLMPCGCHISLHGWVIDALASDVVSVPVPGAVQQCHE